MAGNLRALRFAVLTCLFAISVIAAAETRTWTDNQGRSVTAELVGVQGGTAILRMTNGQQFSIAVKELSPADRALLENNNDKDSPRRRGGKGAELVEVAEAFFVDLRQPKREDAGATLTAKAQEVLKSGKSPLVSLPTPDADKRAVRVGRPKLSGETAELPAQVKTGDDTHKLRLQLRRESDQWRISGVKLLTPGGEQVIDFESEGAANSPAGPDPLAHLVGQPIQITGMTLQGAPLDVSRYQGKVVLVEFWSLQSEPSRSEMSNVFANFRKYAEKGFDVVGVNIDQDLDLLEKFTKRANLPWVTVVDVMSGPQAMALRYQVRNLPTSILVGKDGKVVAVNRHGPQLGEELEKLLGGGSSGKAKDSKNHKQAATASELEPIVPQPKKLPAGVR